MAVKKLGGCLVGLIVICVLISLFIHFFLIMAGIALLIWGIKKLKINKSRNLTTKFPIALIVIGLVIGISGVAYAFSKPNTSKSTETSNSNTEEVQKTIKNNTDPVSKTSISTDKKENSQDDSSAKKAVVTVASDSDKNTSTSKSNISKAQKVDTPSNLVPAIVSKNTDGDTIHVTLKGKDETVRMLLIDTPEDVDPKAPIEPYAYTAANYAKKVLPVGKHIYLEEGKKGYTRDKYNRLLAFVYITPKDMYNADVVKKGYARVAYIYPPNTQHLSTLQSDQSYAKSHKLGIWSISNYVTSSGYSKSISCSYASKNGYSTRTCGTVSTKSASSSTKKATSTSNVSKTSASSSSSSSNSGAFKNNPDDDKQSNMSCEGKIKGNANSKIYHVPGDAYYDRTKDNIVWFCTEADAQKAGYRKSER